MTTEQYWQLSTAMICLAQRLELFRAGRCSWTALCSAWDEKTEAIAIARR